MAEILPNIWIGEISERFIQSSNIDVVFTDKLIQSNRVTYYSVKSPPNFGYFVPKLHKKIKKGKKVLIDVNVVFLLIAYMMKHARLSIDGALSAVESKIFFESQEWRNLLVGWEKEISE